MCRCSAERSRRFTYVNVQVFCGKIPKVYELNVQVFYGKIPKVSVRECAGVLREDPEGLRT
jgi:hypothetical protein